MANGKFLIGKPSGGVTTVTVTDGATNTNLVLPESGTVSGVTTVVTDNAIARYDGTTGNLQNSGVIIDDNNNVGIGVTPNINTTMPTIFGSNFLMTTSYLENYSMNNASFQGSNYKYLTSDRIATSFAQVNNGYIWKTAASGTAGNDITWTTAMTLDASGALIHSAGVKMVQPSANTYLNATATVIDVGNMVNNRSINARGTINASGADYAEYEYSNDITVTKGQIVGFKADGALTDKYNESVRFAIKSTNPSIVGGDTWGIEDIVGKRPEQPVRKLDKTEQVKIEDSEEFETVVIEAGDTDAEWEEIKAKYKEELIDFEERLEVERQKVDRIAYAGKVPVNVYDATPGQYIVAIEKDGGIDGLAVNKADMTFAQYQDAVGRVNKILDDGRAEVAVIIH